jgi:molybdopterin-binding protein
MPRKEQGWITFQTSDEERQILEQICQSSQRTKTEVLRELVRELGRRSLPSPAASPATEPLPDAPVSSKKLLKVSSRNVLKGKVTRVITGSVNTEITLEIVHRVALTSIITRSSAEELGLVEGVEAYAVIKSSDVVIAME